MLRRFLLIGVGGSGGKTLRFLHRDLEQRLRAVGCSDGFPLGWQFLNIDVPPSPDGNEAALPPQLPDGSYVGLAVPNVSYRALDGVLVPSDPSERNLRELVGWRPNPANVHVDIAAGAGQHRTLGRVIAIANLRKIRASISAAVQRMSLPEATSQLDRISQAFGNGPTNNPPAPVTIVVSSLAGGSGAGIFLDVCDVLKSMGQSWTSNSMALLFAPDVFEDLPQLGRAGVYPNALAALSELLAGYWNTEPIGEAEYTLYAAAGIEIAGTHGRGPRYPYIIGRSNQRIHFGGQIDVYEGAGSAIAAILTSASAQDDLFAYKFAQWAANATNMTDNLGLKTHLLETPLSSLGFASVSLGRDRFARYASERLARMAVEHVLRAHWVGRDVPEKTKPEDALEESRRPSFNWFLEESGLEERGDAKNDILESLRPSNQAALIEAMVQRIRTNVTSGRAALKASLWSAALCRAFAAAEHEFLGDIQVRIQAHAEDEWVPAIQTKIQTLTAKALSTVGGPVTVSLLTSLIDELDLIVIGLGQELERFRRWTLQRDGAIHDDMAKFGDSRLMNADSEFFSRAVERGRRTFEWGAEAELRAFAADVIRDLMDGLLRPLRKAVEGSVAVLMQEERPATEGPTSSMIRDWPEGDNIPRSFEPAVNERLVEPVSAFSSMFIDRIAGTVSAGSPDDATREAVRQVVLGASAAGNQQIIEQMAGWWPARLSSGSAVASRARFEVKLDAHSILDRAHSWVHAPDTRIGVYAGESLAEYLGAGVDSAVLPARLEHFRAAFAEALDLAAPLVNINASVLGRVHSMDPPKPSYSFTEIPFPDHTPGRDLIERVMRARDIDPSRPEIAKFFGDGDQARIDILSVFDAPMEPVVFDSIMAPIAADWTARKSTVESRKNFWKWRRSRPLGRFTPMAPEVRRNFITGWWAARLLGQLRWPDVSDASAVEAWIPGERTWLPFPFPLITPPESEVDLLPAVLESLPLAIVAYATRGSQGDQALMPYRRLSALGDDPQPAIQAWIMNGRVPPGTPTPDERAGTASDDADVRLKQVVTYLESRQARYAKLTGEPVDRLNFFELRWIWELGGDLDDAFDKLLHVVRSIDMGIDNHD